MSAHSIPPPHALFSLQMRPSFGLGIHVPTGAAAGKKEKFTNMFGISEYDIRHGNKGAGQHVPTVFVVRFTSHLARGFARTIGALTSPIEISSACLGKPQNWLVWRCGDHGNRWKSGYALCRNSG